MTSPSTAGQPHSMAATLQAATLSRQARSCTEQQHTAAAGPKQRPPRAALRLLPALAYLALALVGQGVGGHEDDLIAGLDDALLHAARQHITHTLDLVDTGDGQAQRGVGLALGHLRGREGGWGQTGQLGIQLFGVLTAGCRLDTALQCPTLPSSTPPSTHAPGQSC